MTSPRMSRQQWQSQCLSPGLLAPPHLLPLPAEPWSPLTHLLLSLHARGQQGMTQDQADAGSVREHCSRGRRIRAVCRHRVPGPACSSFSSCCRTDRWISVGILGRSVHSPLPQASQPQLTSWALSPGPSLCTQRYQPWGGGGSYGHRAGQGPVGVGRTAQDLGRVGSGVGGVGSHLAGLPTLLTPLPFLQRCFQTTNGYLSDSRSCSSNYNVAALATSSLVGELRLPPPAPRTCTVPRSHWWWEGQSGIAAGRTSALLDAQVSKGQAPCGILQGLGVPAPLGFSCWVLLKF